MTYIEGSQQVWDEMTRHNRQSWLRVAGVRTKPLAYDYADCFDIYGDMPPSVSEALVRDYAAHYNLRLQKWVRE